MRGRAFKVRQVFAELHYALGNELPTIELLDLATRLVDATSAPSDDDDEIVTLHLPGEQLPLDEAFADGGWKIMARHRAYDGEQFEDDPFLSERARFTLDRLMKR